MAQLKKIRSFAVPASSLLEVIVAMVVLLIVFALAMTIFTNVTRSTLSLQKVKAAAILHHLMTEAERQHDFTARTFQKGDFRIEENVKPFAANPALNIYEIVAFDQNNIQVDHLQKVISTGP